jgi:hypothetical protein
MRERLELEARATAIPNTLLPIKGAVQVLQAELGDAE